MTSISEGRDLPAGHEQIGFPVGPTEHETVKDLSSGFKQKLWQGSGIGAEGPGTEQEYPDSENKQFKLNYN